MDERIKKELEDMVDTLYGNKQLTMLLRAEDKSREEILAELEAATVKQLKVHGELADKLDTRGKQARHNLATELRLGNFTDFGSPHAMPCMELVERLTKLGDEDLAEKVRNGDYD